VNSPLPFPSSTMNDAFMAPSFVFFRQDPKGLSDEDGDNDVIPGAV